MRSEEAAGGEATSWKCGRVSNSIFTLAPLVAAYREALKNDIREGWENNIHRDEEVAEEWGEAFFQIFQSIHHK